MDKITHRVALMMLVVALLHATSIASHFASAELARYLAFQEKGLAVLAILIMLALLLLMIKKRSMRSLRRGSEPESFINDVAKTSFSVAFAVTLALVIALDLGDGKYIADLPVDVLTDLIKMILLGSFSVSFFVLNNTGGTLGSDAGLSE